MMRTPSIVTAGSVEECHRVDAALSREHFPRFVHVASKELVVPRDVHDVLRVVPLFDGFAEVPRVFHRPQIAGDDDHVGAGRERRGRIVLLGVQVGDDLDAHQSISTQNAGS